MIKHTFLFKNVGPSDMENFNVFFFVPEPHKNLKIIYYPSIEVCFNQLIKNFMLCNRIQNCHNENFQIDAK